MGSSKGKPTDPKLREQAKEEVKAGGEGGAPGQWTANKAMRMSKKYEEKGGDYVKEGGSKNEPKKGKPEPADKDAKAAKKGAKSATDKATAVKKTQETKKKAAPKRKSAAGKDEGEDKSKKATPKKATPKKKQGGKKGGDKNGEVLKQFQQHVNMDEDELKKWLDSQESKDVGWNPSGGESVGRKSAKQIIELLEKEESDLTDDDIAHMKHVNSYCKRHLKQRPKKDVESSKWRYSLMNWGHDPLKNDK
eukprot:jgi/Astpho2/4136/Aster-x0606